MTTFSILHWASQVALVVKNPPANAGRHKRFDPWVRKIPWRGAQWNLGGYSPQGHIESDTTEATNHASYFIVQNLSKISSFNVCLQHVSYLQCSVEVVLVAQYVPLFATPGTMPCKAPLPMEFSRQEYWSGLPFPSPGDVPDPGIELRSLAQQADSLLSEPSGKPKVIFSTSKLPPE